MEKYARPATGAGAGRADSRAAIATESIGVHLHRRAIASHRLEPLPSGYVDPFTAPIARPSTRAAIAGLVHLLAQGLTPCITAEVARELWVDPEGRQLLKALAKVGAIR